MVSIELNVNAAIPCVHIARKMLPMFCSPVLPKKVISKTIARQEQDVRIPFLKIADKK